MLSKVVEILNDYDRQGYKLTLRQLYYQLVTRNVIPNALSEYEKLGNLVVKGRMSGVIDWDAIEDRIRIPKLPYSVNDVEDAILDTAKTYRIDRMRNQPTYIEMWVEKDALSSVLIK